MATFIKRLFSRNNLEHETQQQSRRANAEIARHLELDQKTDGQQLSLLILGAGDSGKSTLMKQVRRIHATAMDRNELLQSRPFIFRALAESFYVLTEFREMFGDDFKESDTEYTHIVSITPLPESAAPPDESKECDPDIIYDQDMNMSYRIQREQRRISDAEQSLRRKLDLLHQHEFDVPTSIDFYEYAQEMAALWKTQDIQVMFEKRNELVRGFDGRHDFNGVPADKLRRVITTPCMDTIPYYMNRVDDNGYVIVGRDDYIPSFEDFVHLRMPTTGVNRLAVRYTDDQTKRHHNITFTDVGGQRNERKKWIHVFDGVTAICWVVSLSEYDQVLYEDANKKRFEESFELFSSIVQMPTFSKTNFVVFLNKCDLFEEKLLRTPFPFGNDDEITDRRDKDQIVNFMKGMYSEEFKSHTANRADRFVTFYVTQATDSEIVEQVTRQVFASLVMKGFAKMGM